MRQYRTASHVVAERRERPDGIDDDTFDSWIRAHTTVGRRKYDISTAPVGPPAERPELQKERLRKPRAIRRRRIEGGLPGRRNLTPAAISHR